MVPFDDKSPFVTSGMRIGTAAVTTRGFKEKDMKKTVDLIDRILIHHNQENIIAETKMEAKVYLRYSGYPGGLKSEGAKHLAKRKGYGALLENAIYGMLPKNKLRKGRMRLLSITE